MRTVAFALFLSSVAFADQGVGLVYRSALPFTATSFAMTEAFRQNDYQSNRVRTDAAILGEGVAVAAWLTVLGGIYQASKDGPFEGQDVAAYAAGSLLGVGISFLLHKEGWDRW